MPDQRDDEPFLKRWSRQKRRSAEPLPAALEPAGAIDEIPVDTASIDPATLPDIETLTADSDITAFLRDGVPVALQRLALRKMWALDPGIRDFVEVAENQWDFNAVGGVQGLFEEIPPGTDTSAWIAQATQSMLPSPPSDHSGDLSSAGGPERLAAMQQDAVDLEPGTRHAVVPTSRRTMSAIAVDDQPSHRAQISDIAPDNGSAAGRPPTSRRRRHGGALPE